MKTIAQLQRHHCGQNSSRTREEKKKQKKKGAEIWAKSRLEKLGKKKCKNMSNPDREQPGKTQARNPARNAERGRNPRPKH